jgi:hypothetical protein
VPAITTMLKDQMVERIARDGRLVYKALAAGTSAQVPNLEHSQKIVLDDAGKDVVHFAMSNFGKRADFWELIASGQGETPLCFDIRSTALPVPLTTPETPYTLRPRMEKMPDLAFGNVTLDFAEKNMREVTKKYGITATNTRQGNLKAILACTSDKSEAQRLDGANVYFSFKRPILLGRPLKDTEWLPLARFVKIVSSEAEIFAGTIDASKERSDFESYFAAAQQVWAVLAEVHID